MFENAGTIGSKIIPLTNAEILAWTDDSIIHLMDAVPGKIIVPIWQDLYFYTWFADYGNFNNPLLRIISGDDLNSTWGRNFGLDPVLGSGKATWNDIIVDANDVIDASKLIGLPLKMKFNNGGSGPLSGGDLRNQLSTMIKYYLR